MRKYAYTHVTNGIRIVLALRVGLDVRWVPYRTKYTPYFLRRKRNTYGLKPYIRKKRNLDVVIQRLYSICSRIV